MWQVTKGFPVIIDVVNVLIKCDIQLFTMDKQAPKWHWLNLACLVWFSIRQKWWKVPDIFLVSSKALLKGNRKATGKLIVLSQLGKPVLHKHLRYC